MSQYRTIEVQDLRPGEWVMDFPRDKHVSVVVRYPLVDLALPNADHLLASQQVAVVYTDRSSELFLYGDYVFVALPDLKRPYLTLPKYAGVTRQDEHDKEVQARVAAVQDGLNELYIWHQERVEERGAIDMVAGREFIGYVGQDDEKWWVECWSWGVNHGRVYGVTREEAEGKAFAIYDGGGR